MNELRKAKLTSGDIKTLLFRLTVPMIFGMLGMIIFNIVDTYFVSRLGTNELAALTFTFPVVLIINSISLGIGTGVLSVLSKSIGEGDKRKIVRYASDSLVLGILVAGIFVAIGLATIEPLFTLLGAEKTVMPHIVSYMRIWYIGIVFVVIPMVGNNIIRALGDTKTPAMVMVVAAVANSILDPIFIFGWGPVPGLGVAGAALATVLARMTTFTVALHVLTRREKIISYRQVSLRDMILSWKHILYVGLPNALTRIIQPVGIGIITGLLASHGIEAVAGFGVAAKFERFALIPVMALAVIMTPFVGQNYGANRCDRVEKSMAISYRYSMISMGGLYAFLFLTAPYIAAVFSDDPAVVSIIILYMRLVPLGYGAYGVLQISISVMNAFRKPLQAAMVMVGQLFLVYIPLALAGSRFLGLKGIFGALALSYFIAAVPARYLARGFAGKGIKPDMCEATHNNGQ